MRDLKVPEKGPKRILLDAAERLVAEKGFDAVSVRDITGAAKANVAAVNYHFGSREGLMDMIVFRVLDPLLEERQKALEQAERQRAGKKASAADLIRVFTLSLAAARDRMGMDVELFRRLAGRILVLPDETLPPLLAVGRRSVREKYLKALGRVLTELAGPELASRWMFFESGLAQSLLDPGDGADLDELLERSIRFCEVGLGGGLADKVPEDDKQGLLFDF